MKQVYECLRSLVESAEIFCEWRQDGLLVIIKDARGSARSSILISRHRIDDKDYLDLELSRIASEFNQNMARRVWGEAADIKKTVALKMLNQKI